VTPSPTDLAELAAKYERLAELRREKERDGTVPERAVFKALATRFPGVLNELDTLTLGEIDTRAEALDAAARGAAIEPWMAWIHGYHALLRAALGIKARTARSREIAPARVHSLADDASREAGLEIDAAFVRAVVRPAGGRILPVVYARLAVEHGVTADAIADALFPRRRARRSSPL
jgi:hypothetical protein